MIPHNKPLSLSFDIGPDVLQGEKDQKSKFVADESFTHPAHCQVELKQKHRMDDVELQGEVSCQIEAVCSRCGQSFEYNYQEHLFIICARKQEVSRKAVNVSGAVKNKTSKRSKHKAEHEDSFEQAQEGLVFFANEEIDLTHIIREQILLNLPMRYVCSEQCRGLCSLCGEKLEAGHECSKSKTSK